MTLNILFGLATEFMNDIFGGLIQRVCEESSHTGGGPVDCQVLGVAGLTTPQLGAQRQGGAVVASSQVKPSHHHEDTEETLQSRGQARSGAE